jgi:hypothetical protein
LHLGFEIAEVVFDSTLANKWCVELNVLLAVLGVHTKSSLVRFWTFFQELKVAETVKAVSNLFIDLDWVVSVGEDVK